MSIKLPKIGILLPPKYLQPLAQDWDWAYAGFPEHVREAQDDFAHPCHSPVSAGAPQEMAHVIEVTAAELIPQLVLPCITINAKLRDAIS